jgi:hypothetical protein
MEFDEDGAGPDRSIIPVSAADAMTFDYVRVIYVDMKDIIHV